MRVLGARCVVREEKLEAKTISGIVIPGREKEQTNRGTVISVGAGAMLDNGTRVPMDVAEGDMIVYASFSGSPIMVNNETFIILNERDILCVIGEKAPVVKEFVASDDIWASLEALRTNSNMELISLLQRTFNEYKK